MPVRRILLSVGAAAALLAGFLYLLDPAQILEHLRGTDVEVFALGLLAILVAMACWSEAARRLFRAANVYISRRRSFLAYGAGAFGKQVLPMGNAGGPAVMAYAYDREASVGYSHTLAVVVTAEFLSLLASVCMALLGVGVLLAVDPTVATLRVLGAGIVIVALGVVALGVALSYRRRHVTLGVLALAHVVHPVVDRVSSRLAARIDPTDVAVSVERSFAAIDAVTADRRAVGVAFALTLLGWVCFALPLYTAGVALGTPLSLALVLALVPAAGLATIVPLPGGLGGFELILAGMVTALGGLDLAAGAAVVILYRLCSFWFFVLVGGLCASASAVNVRGLADTLEETADSEDPFVEPPARSRVE